MDHVVYLDAQAKELDLLLSAKKTMIIRGTIGRKLPYGRVDPGDILYLINNNAEGVILASAEVESVINSDKMTSEESISTSLAGCFGRCSGAQINASPPIRKPASKTPSP